MSQRQGEAAALGNTGLVYSANGELDPAARQRFTEALHIMNHKREAIECFIMDDLPRAVGRCELVNVPRDELVMVLSHLTEQAERQPDRTRVDTYTHPW